MVKNIFNWTIGGFFRSLGRILCYIVVGVAIAYLIGSSDIKPKIKISDLIGIEKVSASTWGSQWISGSEISTDWGQNYSTMYEVENYYTYNNILQPTGTALYWMKFNNGPISINQDTENIYATIRFRVNTNEQIGTNGNEQQFRCNTNANFEWGNYFEGDMGDDVEVWYNYFTCVAHNYTESSTVVKPEFSLHLDYFTTSESALPQCMPYSNNGYEYTFKCPIVQNVNQIRGFRLAVNTKNAINYDLGLFFNYLYDKDKTQAIIDSQNETTQSIDHQTEIISDTNTTQEENATAQFFSQNHTSADGPLSSIVSAPLALIHNLTTGSSNPLCFTLKGKQSCLPSGQFIWGKTTRTGIDWFGGGALSSGISAFVALFNLVVGGFLAYKMVLSLFRIVEGLLNPKSTKVEVIKL